MSRESCNASADSLHGCRESLADSGDAHEFPWESQRPFEDALLQPSDADFQMTEWTMNQERSSCRIPTVVFAQLDSRKKRRASAETTFTTLESPSRYRMLTCGIQGPFTKSVQVCSV